MAVTIATNVGASMTTATGRSTQSHLVYGVNNAKWYLFYLTGTQVLSLAYSSDFTTWATSGTTLTLARIHNSYGTNFGFAYKNIASTDVVHMSSDYILTSPLCINTHTRFTLGATSWSVTNAETQLYSNAASGNSPTGCVCAFDSNNLPIVSSGFCATTTGTCGDVNVIRATNTDGGSSWTAGWGTNATIRFLNNESTYNALVSIGSGHLLIITDDGTTYNTLVQPYSSIYTTSWPSESSFGSAVTATSTNNMGVVDRTISDIHFVVLNNNSNAFTHLRNNGTNWTTLSGAAIPTLTLHSQSGLFLATDGTNVWLFAIDSSNNVQYTYWNGSTWGSWTILVAGGASARTYISGFSKVVNNTIGVIWTEVNGSNYNIAGALLSLGATTTLVRRGMGRRAGSRSILNLVNT